MVIEEKHYRKALIIFGILFIALSAIELINIFLLLNTSINLYGRKMLFQDFMLNFDIMPLSGIVLFFSIVCSIFVFLILGFLLLKTSSKKIVDNKLRAKKILILGVTILIFSFIKLAYVNFLGRIEIDISGKTRTFLHIITGSTFGPYYIIVIWLFFTGVICFTLMAGLVLGGLGLNWDIELKRKETEGD